MEVVRDEAAFPDILWTFHQENPSVETSLADRLGPGIARGRVCLYSGIDCNQLFPELLSAWANLHAPDPLVGNSRSNPVEVSEEFRHRVEFQPQLPTTVEGDDEDRPPYVEICVGRETELKAIRTSTAKIVFVTGLGGQGKSTVAARFFSEARDSHLFSVFVWRDCKGETERFENQLASVVERFSGGRISGQDLAKQSAASIVEVLMSFIKDRSVLFVFDNVDHYVDLENRSLIAGPNSFVEALLRSQFPSRAIFTCRPSVVYDPSRVLTCHLEGLGLPAAKQLFSARNAPSTSEEIEDAHSATEGHAFWLDLLATQVAKRDISVNLRRLVRDIRSGSGRLPENTFNSIWATLNERERTVLRAMAETVRPETTDDLARYFSSTMHYRKLMRTISGLRTLNLVVVKRSPNAPDVLELHPMVRHFIRTKFTRAERVGYIDPIIKAYRFLIGNHRPELLQRPSLSVLHFWTGSAELATEAGRYSEAFKTLEEVADPFESSAYPREFCRVARFLLASVDCVSDHAKFSGFEGVFDSYVTFLNDLGEFAEVDELLELYEKTVPQKDARYINYCDMRCFAAWSRGEFSRAVEWGKSGRDLKASGVDTEYDVTQHLALAERDAGHPESALTFFLFGRPLSQATDTEEPDEELGGEYYGNIGRCLQFMGQIDGALTCFQKSALLLEKSRHIVNQGFARQWIGEVLAGRQLFNLAKVFYRAAYLKCQHTSPPRAQHMLDLSRELEVRAPRRLEAGDAELEMACRDWIFGRALDAEYR
jgi:tetratricopeptide (TPR) repeat protein